VPRLLAKRWLRHGYKQIRCALCYRRFRPGQARVDGANYFPHPYMACHPKCALAHVAGVVAARAWRTLRA
jgi:hypothetical protein